MDCFIDPCEVATCPGAPYATCKSNYCGGCNARFFIGDEDITDTCGKYLHSKNGPTLLDCNSILTRILVVCNSYDKVISYIAQTFYPPAWLFWIMYVHSAV